MKSVTLLVLLACAVATCVSEETTYTAEMKYSCDNTYKALVAADDDTIVEYGVTMHGTFVKMRVDSSKMTGYFRPDIGNETHGLSIIVPDDGGECDVTFDDIRQFIPAAETLVFTNRENATFESVAVYKYYNTTDEVFYIDKVDGFPYGICSGDACLYKATGRSTKEVSASEFALPKSAKCEAKKEAFSKPSSEAFKAACGCSSVAALSILAATLFVLSLLW
jgi:hypothetical protein